MFHSAVPEKTGFSLCLHAIMGVALFSNSIVLRTLLFSPMRRGRMVLFRGMLPVFSYIIKKRGLRHEETA